MILMKNKSNKYLGGGNGVYVCVCVYIYIYIYIYIHTQILLYYFCITVKKGWKIYIFFSYVSNLSHFADTFIQSDVP